MEISVGGLVKLTTIDYPGSVAAVIFFQGCPWRCEYCHNSHLWPVHSKTSLIPWKEVLEAIYDRKDFIDAVVFSGGEPLLQSNLGKAVNDVKKMNLKIGLHTSGYSCDRFARVLPLVDWVGFDVKYKFEDYSKITNIENSGVEVLDSLNLLILSGVDYEVRMTIYKTISAASVAYVLNQLSDLGVKTVVLQKCRDKYNNVFEHPIFYDSIFIDNISKCFNSFSIRE